MNTNTSYSLDTMIRANDVGRLQMTKFIQIPEVRMFIHDLRHLVQAIVGSVDTLQIALEEHAEELAMKSLGRLKQNTDIAIDMLGYFGTDLQTDGKHNSVCDVAQEIQRVLDLLAPLLRQKGITVQQNVLSPVIAAIRKTDFNRLLLNLLLNAIEATERPDAIININVVAVLDESVQITVKDNGNGIGQKELAKIFAEGYTTKAQQGNKGLGLAIVKQLLETYHGTMHLQSFPGKGVQFMIQLPRLKKKKRIETTVSNPTI